MKARRWSAVSRIVVILLALFTLATPVFAATVAGSGTGTTTVDEYSLDYSWEITYQKASESDSNTSDYKNGSGNVTYSDGAFTLKAKSSYYNAGGLFGWGKKIVYNYTTILTLTNNGDYGCKITYNTSGALGTVTGATKDLAKGESTSFTVATTTGPTVTTAQDLSGTVTITAIEVYDKVNVGFASFPNGSYTYQIGDTTTSVEPGAATVTQELAANSTVTLTAGDAVEGYAFYGWMSSGSLLSTESPYEYSVNVAGDVYPVFISSEAKTAGEPFKVGDNSYMFWHLAFEAAKLSGDPVRVNQNMTLPTSLLDNGLLSGHKYSDFISVSNGTVNYIVPSGSRLLIPYGSEDTVGSFSGTPSNYLSQADAWDLYKEGGTAARNFVYRCLTVPAGAKIDCYGSINVNGQRQETGQPYIGVSVGGYGKLLLNGAGTEQLTVHGGGFLYAYGYITGSGKVNVLSGGEVHELMQVCDWPGGSNAYNWRVNADKNTLFLLSQYYIQNIETTLQVNSGAMAYAEVTIHGSNQTIPKSAPYIGSSTGLFRLGSNSYIVRNYDTSEDRVEYVLYGTASLGEISVSFDFIGTINLTSSSFVMPINGNMTLRVAEGTMSFDQRAAFLPGSQLIIDEGATVNLGGQVHIVDVKDFTKSYFFDRSGLVSKDHSPQFNALPYVATKDSISPRTNKLVLSAEKNDKGEILKQYYLEAKTISTSALVQVDGALNVSGQLLTTNKTSSPSANKAITGSGVINYTSTPAVTNLKGGEGETINTMTSTYGLANIVGEGLLQPIDSAGTYYGFYADADNDGTEEYWWSTNKQTIALHLMLPDGTEAETRYIPMYDGFDMTAYYTDAACTTKATSDFAGTDLYAIAEAKIVRSDETHYTVSLQSAVQLANRSGDQVYLLRDTAVDKAIKIEASQDLSVYLDGHTITYTSRVFENYGVLNLDFQGGSMKSGATVPYTAIVANQKDGTLNMTLNGGTLLWSTSAAPYKGTFGLVQNNSGGTANIDLSGGTMNLEYKYSQTYGYEYRFYTIYNCGTMDLKDSAGTGLLTSSYRGNSTFATGGSTRGWAILPAPLCNYNGTLTAQNLRITDTSASGGNAGCIISYHGTITELRNVTMESNYHYGLVNTGGTINSIVDCQIDASTYGIYNGSTYKCPDSSKANDFAITKQGNIKEITDTKITVTGTSAILNRAQIGTIGGSSELKAKTATIHVDNIVCGSGSNMITTTTDDAGNTVKTYNWAQIPTIGKINDSVTITATSYNAITNEGTITEISGKVSINANAASDSSRYAVGVLSGGYIGAIKENVSINSSGHNAVYLSGQRISTETTDANGTNTIAYDRTSGIGSISGTVLTATYNTINNAGNIEKIEDGTVVLATTDSTDYYALKNTGSIELISGGNYYHPEGASNIVNNSGTLNYPDGHGISKDTQSITVNGKLYDCYYVTAVHTHEYPDKPTFEWTETDTGYSVTATLTCGAEDCPDDPFTGEATVTSEVIENATCTEPGKELFTAKVKLNEQEYEDTKEVDIPAQGHAYGDLIPVQEAIHTQTELKAGVAAHYQCFVCKKYFTEEKAETTLEALTGEVPEHTYGEWINIDPEKHWQECSGCQLKSGEAVHSDGDDADASCDICGRELHTCSGELANGKPADCTNDGWGNYVTCSCGKFYSDVECKNEIADLTAWKSGAGKIDATGHEKTTTTKVDATCTQNGSVTVTCDACDATISTETIEAQGHFFGQWTKTKDPTCTEKGEDRRDCKNCDHVETRAVDAKGHTEGTVVVENEKAATCTAEGSYDNVIYCSICNAELSRNTIAVEKVAHDYKTVVTEPTCTDKGYTTYTCSVCGDSYVADEVAALGHTPGETVVENNVPSDYNNAGSYENVVYCTVCNVELSRNKVTVPMLQGVASVNGTNYGSLDEAVKADGDVIIILQDIILDTVVDATGKTVDFDGHTITGTLLGTLKLNGGMLVTAEGYKMAGPDADYYKTTDAVFTMDAAMNINVLSGTMTLVPNEWWTMPNQTLTISQNATFVIPRGKTMQVQGTVIVEGTVTVNGKVNLHNANATVTAAEGLNVTTTAGDKVWYTNGKYMVHNHTAAEAVVKNNVAPDCTNAGSYDNVIYCSVCGDELSREKVTVGALGHSYESVVTAPTFDAQGYTTHTCSKCSDSYVDSYVAARVAVAKVGSERFESLTEAVVAAKNGDTVILLSDATGAGVVIDKSITIDFGGYTYTLTEGVGSTGTESNGLQLLKGNDITLMNGALEVAVASKSKFYILVQNYANLTVKDMDLDGTNLDKWSATDGDSYVLSNNSGTVNVIGETSITANNDGEKAFAFDVCKNGSYDAPTVNVNTTETIKGQIEVTDSITNNLNISGGTFTVKIEENWCAEGFIPTANADGTYGVKKGVYVAQNGETKYETLAAAAAADGDTILVLQDITIYDPITATGKTIDFNGKTIAGTVLGTLKLNGGTLVTAEGYKMAGPDADYYETTDAVFTMDAAMNINVLSGTMTLVPNEWWTMPNQTLTISQNATFVIPRGKTMQVQGTVIVEGTVTVNGKVNLHNANATVTAAEGLNVTTTAGDKVWYTNGKYMVHNHTAAEAVVKNNVAPDCTNAGSYDNVIYCSVCGDELSREKVTVGALGHTAGEAEIENDVKPTCTTDGSYDTVVYCTVCDAELSRVTTIVKTEGHAWVDADCDTPKTCSACGATEGKPTGEHTYENGVCTGCGEKEPASTIDITVERVGATKNDYGAVVTAPDGGWKEGTNTFYVDCEQACVVVVSYDKGVSYERLPATADGSRYKFTVENVTVDTLLKVLLNGDINGDGKVYSSDITQLSAIYAEKRTPNALYSAVIDVNFDGELKPSDITRVSVAFAGKRQLSWTK